MARPFPQRLGRSCDEQQALTPNKRGFHCARCEKDVVDLTRLTRKQAQPYLQTKGCIRINLGPNGEPVFAPEVERRSVRGLLLAGAMAVGCVAMPPRSPEKSADRTELVMTPTDVPVGIATDEIDGEVFASFDSPAGDEDQPEKVLPVRHVPVIGPPTTAWMGDYDPGFM
jgi:hypothetical protein